MGGCGQLAGSDRATDAQLSAAQAFGDHFRQQPLRPVAEGAASSLPVLPEMRENVGQPRLIARADRRIGKRRERSPQRFKVQFLGARIMVVEGRTADVGMLNDIRDANVALAGVEDEMIPCVDQCMARPPRATITRPPYRISGLLRGRVR